MPTTPVPTTPVPTTPVPTTPVPTTPVPATPTPTTPPVLGCCIRNNGTIATPLYQCAPRTVQANCTGADAVWNEEFTCCELHQCAFLDSCNDNCLKETVCGDRPGCYGGVHDGLECRTLADCFGGYKCVPLEKACRNDGFCRDCQLQEDQKRANGCRPCRHCDSVADALVIGANATGDALRCCLEGQQSIKYTAVLRGSELENSDYSPDYKRASSGFVGKAMIEWFPDSEVAFVTLMSTNLPAPNDVYTLEFLFSSATPRDDFLVGQPKRFAAESFTDSLKTDLDSTLGLGVILAPFVGNAPQAALGGRFVRDSETSRPAGSCDAPGAGGSCRARLGCECANCEDECDTDVILPAPIQAADCNGVEPAYDTSADWSLVFGQFQPEIQPDCAGAVAEKTCKAIVNGTCCLDEGEWRRASLEARRTPTVLAWSNGPMPYDDVHYDLYRIEAAERSVTVKMRRTDSFAAKSLCMAPSTLELLYLIDATQKCDNSAAIRSDRPALIECDETEPNTFIRTITWHFLMPRRGTYIVVASAIARKKRANGNEVPLGTIRGLACINYRLMYTASQIQCPAALCELDACRGARDCDLESCNDLACATQYGRCALAAPSRGHHHVGENYGDDEDGDESSSWSSSPTSSVSTSPSVAPDVCAGEPDGVACIVRGERCGLGVCASEMCSLEYEAELFECDCHCPRECRTYLDCNDRNPETIDLCEPRNGVCLHRPKPVVAPAPLVCPLIRSNVSELEQPVLAACRNTSTTGVAVNGTCSASLACQLGLTLTDNSDQQVLVECTPSAACATADSVCTCAMFGADVCVRRTSANGTAQAVLECTDLNAAPAAAAGLRLFGGKAAAATAGRASLLAFEIEAREGGKLAALVQMALDNAEVAHAAAALDQYGGGGGSACAGAAIESRVIVAGGDAELTDECGSIAAAQCLAADSDSHSGAEWLDRAWRSLDRATRAQITEPNSRNALYDACCAQLFYGIVARECGRGSESSERLSNVRIERSFDSDSGCVAFDDGHRDRDLNDWVAEQRVVELRDSTSGELVAINVHVRPLARGAGYRSAYTMSLRGTGVASLGTGANAACSERARAVFEHTYNADAVAAALRARRGAEFDAATSVTVRRHVLGAAELPAGVLASQHTTRLDGAATSTVPLFADTRTTLPPSAAWLNSRVGGAGVAAAAANDEYAIFDELARVGAPVDASINTRRNTYRVEPLYAASAVIVVPRNSAAQSARSLQFVLENIDCGGAVVLRDVASEPMLSVVVPNEACAAWRWAAEGVALASDPRDTETRVCRGGHEGGYSECSSGDVEAAASCTTSGGLCTQAPASEGVPYEAAAEFLACGRCTLPGACSRNSECVDSECCSERVQLWYARVSEPTLVYRAAPRSLDSNGDEGVELGI